MHCATVDIYERLETLLCSLQRGYLRVDKLPRKELSFKQHLACSGGCYEAVRLLWGHKFSISSLPFGIK